MRVNLALRSILLFLTVALGPASAQHEGHNHNDTAPPAAAAAAPRGEASSDEFQLVAVLRNGELTIYLDRFATNEPIADATIEVETPAGPMPAKANGNGTYSLPADWAKGSDHYDLIFTVSTAEKADVLPLTITVAHAHADANTRTVSIWSASLIALLAALAAFIAGLLGARFVPALSRKAVAAAAILVAALTSTAQAQDRHDHKNEPQQRASLQSGRDVSQRLPDGGVFMPKSVQRLLTIRTALTITSDHARAIELPGRVIPDPNASGYVQSTLVGRLLPPPNGFPQLGTRVEKGQVLAHVSPPIQQIDVSDMRQKEGELLQQIAIVERRVARFEKLSETGAVSRVQLDDARAELQGLRDRKTSLDQIRREPEVLVAPVAGVIAESNTIAGQLAQPNTVVFHIVDPSRLWVEALSFDAIVGVERATARNHNGGLVSLAFRGSGLAGRNQSIPIHFAIDTGSDGVWAGQFVTVYVTLKDKRKGVLLPRSAVVRAANGQHIVFEQIAAERFEPREVKTEQVDADNVLVLAGIADGRRVVVQGAELIDQVR